MTALKPLIQQPIIVGGGIVGLACALALYKEGITPIIIEAQQESGQKENKKTEGKWFSLAQDTLYWLSSLGVVLPVEPEQKKAQNDPFGNAPYGQSPHDASSDDPALSHGPAMGHALAPVDKIILSYEDASQTPSRPLSLDAQKTGVSVICASISSSTLKNALMATIKKTNIPFFSPDCIASLFCDQWHMHLNLASGRHIKTPLLIGADGHASKTRVQCQAKVAHHHFDQKALVFTVWPYTARTWAYEHFFKGGSLALLPLSPHNHGAGVWIGPEASLLPTALDLTFLCKNRLHHTGDAEKITPGWSSPLSAQWVTYGPNSRCLLIGDAAGKMHPIAGQGLNVSLRNVKDISAHISERYHLGLDIGLSLSAIIKKTTQRTLTMQLSTTLITYGFSIWNKRAFWQASTLPLRHSPYLRSCLLRHASGLVQ